jgi:threonine/homoserine/homoserine lactone efflux protein
MDWKLEPITLSIGVVCFIVGLTLGILLTEAGVHDYTVIVSVTILASVGYLAYLGFCAKVPPEEEEAWYTHQLGTHQPTDRPLRK